MKQSALTFLPAFSPVWCSGEMPHSVPFRHGIKTRRSHFLIFFRFSQKNVTCQTSCQPSLKKEPETNSAASRHRLQCVSVSITTPPCSKLVVASARRSRKRASTNVQTLTMFNIVVSTFVLEEPLISTIQSSFPVRHKNDYSKELSLSWIESEQTYSKRLNRCKY